MFIVSFKINKSRVILAVVILLVLSALVGFGYYMLKYKASPALPTTQDSQANQAEINSTVKYIEGFGWKLDPNPVQTERFQIPNEFNTIYKRYNQYQRDIGTDLNNYKGKVVTRYTFNVLNYQNPPQYAGQQVYADALVYRGNVIAGDLKTNELNGFMVSLRGRSFKEITGIDENLFR